MTGCTRCDFIGPQESALYQAAAGLHRAWHDLYRPIERAAEGLLTIITQETR